MGQAGGWAGLADNLEGLSTWASDESDDGARKESDRVEGAEVVKSTNLTLIWVLIGAS